MEHELSAYYNITHGVGIAILTKGWMRHVLNEGTAPRFAHFAKTVFGVEDKGNDMDTALEGIHRLELWYEKLGIPMTLSLLGVDETKFEEIGKHAVEHEGLLYSWIPLDVKDVVSIYEACL